jgi:hypothetical protein
MVALLCTLLLKMNDCPILDRRVAVFQWSAVVVVLNNLLSSGNEFQERISLFSFSELWFR